MGIDSQSMTDIGSAGKMPKLYYHAFKNLFSFGIKTNQTKEK